MEAFLYRLGVFYKPTRCGQTGNRVIDNQWLYPLIVFPDMIWLMLKGRRPFSRLKIRFLLIELRLARQIKPHN